MKKGDVLKERDGDNLGFPKNGEFQIFRFSDFLKEREGDNLGDGNISGIPKMGNTLNEVLPFLSGDGNISGIPKMGNTLNEVLPFPFPFPFPFTFWE